MQSELKHCIHSLPGICQPVVKIDEFHSCKYAAGGNRQNNSVRQLLVGFLQKEKICEQYYEQAEPHPNRQCCHSNKKHCQYRPSCPLEIADNVCCDYCNKCPEH